MLKILKPITDLLPQVKPPGTVVPIKERMIWTIAALTLFFILFSITALGAVTQSGQDLIQIVTASRLGSLVTTGIGPIVLASIFMQLLAGAKILNVNMQDPEQKEQFLGAQKLLALILSFVEAALFVLPNQRMLDPAFTGAFGVFNTQLLVMFQISIGSIILLYLDEVVTRYGLGSGISLFIVAGVAQSVISGTFIVLFGPQNSVFSLLSNPTAQTLPEIILTLLPVFATLVVVAVVSYAESLKVEIPLSFERGRLSMPFPIKFLYVSNLPVILASAFMLTLVNMYVATQTNSFVLLGVDFAKPVNAALGYVIPTRGYIPGESYLVYLSQFLNPSSSAPAMPELARAGIYIVFLVILCIIFGYIWVDTSGMGAKDVAKQMRDVGWHIRGGRSDPRLMERVMGKYIFVITVLGSMFVGLLAGLADLTGALGTGTGILLSVGILFRLYEDLRQKQAISSVPFLRNLVGE